MTHQFSASMISPDQDFDGAPLLRQEVTLEDGHGAVTHAQLHATALGVFEAFLGGRPVSDDVLSPGWSSYEWRLRYRSYDVTDLLSESTVLGFALGNGWYRGRLGFLGNRAIYGDELGLLAELQITYSDGHVRTVGTDETWRAGPSAVTANDLYDGQTIDARRHDDAWLRPGASPSGWTGVHTLPFDKQRLTAYVGPVAHRKEVVRPIGVSTSPSGRTLVDFGQNLVGWIRCTVQGDAGSVITIRHAEVLEHGELGTRPLRTAKAIDRFVLSGAVDIFEPTKTFHGFRYAEIDGWPGELTNDSLEAVVVHSDLARTGEFECSDALLNQLHRNVVWGLRGNFLDVPTDCPQRDERLGWTGDIAVFAPTAAFLYDVAAFLGDWLIDLDAEQSAADGMIPFVIPDALKYQERPSDMRHLEIDTPALWGDAAAWVPWALWRAYGDRDALQRQYSAMAAHARHVEKLLSTNDLWDTGFQFGDWLDPQAPPDNPFQAKADNGVVATACYFRTLGIVAETAGLLGHDADVAEFIALRDRVGRAFRTHYVADDGTVTSDCQTVYALAIVFGLMPDDLRSKAGDRLAELSAANEYRVGTGFAGTPFVLDALSSTGHLDAAYRLLLEQKCPSWLYPVTMGATTVWERWDSMLPDGSINPGEMTSFNHYALGAVADWMHRNIGGIAPLDPGYDRVLVAPQPGGGLSWARTSLQTRYGRVAVDWRQNDAAFHLSVEIPTGVTAVVRLPGAEDMELGAGQHTVDR
ncbi:MAG TPA: family 78 glycoside hydrolase catalytic domain [Micromonosporaceae bacterium]